MKHYPKNTVRDLLETGAVTAPTKRALKERLRATEDYEPRFFDRVEFELLNAVCRRLIPQSEFSCAVFLDRNFSESRSDGWRYDALPDDAETFRGGLQGIDETARQKFSMNFTRLDDLRKDRILTEIQNGEAAGAAWKTLDQRLFFEELLARTAEVYYAHPLAQEKIGYVGMADAPGWTRIQLDEREEREPRALD